MKSLLSFLTEDEIEHIHEASMQLLEKTGIQIGSEKICRLLQRHGAKVNGKNVKLPRPLVERALQQARHQVLLAGRDAGFDLVVPAAEPPFNTTSGYAPFVKDLETGQTRNSTGRDLKDFAVVSDFLRVIDFFWPIVMPTDEPPPMEELCALDISLRYIRKHIQCSCATEKTAGWQVRLAAAVAGGEDKLRQRPIFSAVVSPVSPLTFEKNAVEAMAALAEAGIPVVPMTMSLSGTTAPATLAGTLTMANAEELATLVILKCANSDAPMVYSTDAAPADLKTGVVNYSAPEYLLLGAACAQMARRYSMPSMVAHGSSEELPYDLPSFERNVLKVAISQMTRTDLASWLGSLESALNASLVSLVGDAEACAHASAYLRRFEVDADTLALGPIDEVGPAGHFLAHKHTVQHFRKELWTKKLQDRFILDPGESSFADQAKQKVREILKGHKVPSLDRDLLKEMDAIMLKARHDILG
jgi:trimethylamine--corrinoid protein Co-methyltransferase